MASKVIVAQEARRDLVSAVDYLADALDAKSAAPELVSSFANIVARLKAFPESYPLCPDESLARRGIRKVLLGGYVVLYRNDGDVSYILRVFHQSQDYARLV